MENDSGILELHWDCGLPPQQYDEWMKVDYDIPTAAPLTEDDIIAKVLRKDSIEGSESSDSEDEDEAPENPPTKSEMLKALDVLWKGKSSFEQQIFLFIINMKFLSLIFSNKYVRETRLNEFFD